MHPRILAIDDDRETTQALARLLTAKGYDVRELNDSTRALEMAREFQPQVVILDYSMPKAHGGDVAWQIASDPLLEAGRGVVCSAPAREEIVPRLPPTRIPILEKPVNTDALLALIHATAGPREAGEAPP